MEVPILNYVKDRTNNLINSSVDLKTEESNTENNTEESNTEESNTKNCLDELQSLTNDKNEIICLKHTTDTFDFYENEIKLLKTTIDKLDLYENEIKRLKTKMDKLDFYENEIKPLNISDFSILKNFMNINISCFLPRHEQLMEIYRRLQNKEMIYTVKIVDHMVKYGRVSYQQNILLFHALTETVIPFNSSLMWFDDLKTCITEFNFRTFFKLTSNDNEGFLWLTIKMLDNQLSTRFITLCTGECGLTYIGRHFEKYEENQFFCNGLLKLKPLQNLITLTNNMFIGYNTKSINMTPSNPGDIAVLYCDTYFSLASINEINISVNKVGVVDFPLNLRDKISFADQSKIEIADSGIIIKL